MGDIFISEPWIALIPAVVFLFAWYMRDDLVAAIAAFSWSGYAVIETLNKYKVTCSGECNIRIDLLMIYPGLILMSVAALVSIALGVAVDSQSNRR